MIDDYRVITLCGSVKFKEDFLKLQKSLTLDGYIVLSVGFFELDKNECLTDKQFKTIKEIHLRKIDLADEVLIINRGGYIGESTRQEIEYATQKGKTIKYLE